MGFRVIWPVNRLVSIDDIIEWYLDAVANDEVTDKNLTNVRDMAEALHEEGLITLGKAQPKD